MASSRLRFMPLSVCIFKSCALSVTRGAALVNKQCSASPIKVAQRLQHRTFRSRSSLAVSAMAKPIVIAPRATHNATVIMLHGLGDTGAGWAGVAQMFAPELPNVKFVFPTAAERPITVNMGMRMAGWFDITSLDKIDQREDAAGLKESAQLIEDLVKEEQSSGINKVVVAGFSQGGAVALLLLRSQLKLAGVAGLSTWLTLPQEELLSAQNQDTPLWMAHGTADQVVRYEYGQASYEKLRAAGANVNFAKYAGMGHEARPGELDEFQAWLGKVLA